MKKTAPTKTEKDTELFIKMVAEKQGWKLNPDKNLLKLLVEGLTVNFNRYGYFSCPCRDASGIKDKDKDIICPCKYSREDIKEYGHCYCGLYLSPEFYSTNKPTEMIPDRRPEELYFD